MLSVVRHVCEQGGVSVVLSVVRHVCEQGGVSVVLSVVRHVCEQGGVSVVLSVVRHVCEQGGVSVVLSVVRHVCEQGGVSVVLSFVRHVCEQGGVSVVLSVVRHVCEQGGVSVVLSVVRHVCEQGGVSVVLSVVRHVCEQGGVSVVLSVVRHVCEQGGMSVVLSVVRHVCEQGGLSVVLYVVRHVCEQDGGGGRPVCRLVHRQRDGQQRGERLPRHRHRVDDGGHQARHLWHEVRRGARQPRLLRHHLHHLRGGRDRCDAAAAPAQHRGRVGRPLQAEGDHQRLPLQPLVPLHPAVIARELRTHQRLLDAAAATSVGATTRRVVMSPQGCKALGTRPRGQGLETWPSGHGPRRRYAGHRPAPVGDHRTVSISIMLIIVMLRGALNAIGPTVGSEQGRSGGKQGHYLYRSRWTCTVCDTNWRRVLMSHSICRCQPYAVQFARWTIASQNVYV